MTDIIKKSLSGYDDSNDGFVFDLTGKLSKVTFEGNGSCSLVIGTKKNFCVIPLESMFSEMLKLQRGSKVGKIKPDFLAKIIRWKNFPLKLNVVIEEMDANVGNLKNYLCRTYKVPGPGFIFILKEGKQTQVFLEDVNSKKKTLLRMGYLSVYQSILNGKENPAKIFLKKTALNVIPLAAKPAI